MRKKLEVLLLAGVVVAVAAFAGSALLGVRGAAEMERAVPAQPEPPREPRFVGGRIRVEVLNAAGTSGLAGRATDRLRDAGFDVVYFGNAREFGRDSSVVIDRAGEPDKARAVAEALGIARVESAPDPALLLEATVLLGEDWPPRREAEPESRAERFWQAVAFWRE